MAQTNRGKLVATFQHPIRVEVRRPKFERSASLAHFDAAKLARAARAEFEVGHFEAGCCRQAVLAVVRRGMVTALRVGACTQHKPIRLTPELQTMLSSAQRRIGRHRDRPFRPMSVAQFMGKGGVAETIIEVACHEFCITVWGHEVCVVCCKSIGTWWCAPVVRTVLE